MGCAMSSSSAPSLTRGERDKIVTDAFAEFIEANCVRGSDKCVHIQKLEAAFAFYLETSGISERLKSSWWRRTAITIVHQYTESLVNAQGLSLSPGFSAIETPEASIPLDTRYVIGMDVVRFQK